jgi:hypothetical protein
MYCQACGANAATKYVAIHQNIGALIMRFSRSVQGNLCKSCVSKYFWEYTTINLFLGWWGIISFILNPFLIINNIYYYLSSLSMPAADESYRGGEQEEIYTARLADDDDDRCYICGKQLQRDERKARVCSGCRA